MSEDLTDDRLVVDDVASNHAHRFETSKVWLMRPCGVRYVHVVVRSPGKRVRLREVGLVCAPTPEREGSFECSDVELTRLWEAGARTIEGAWGDMLVADPAREMRAWVGDLHVGLRSARALSWAATDAEATRFLERVALLRRADGSLPKYAPGEAPEFSTIPGYVLAWVLALAEHAKVSPAGPALAADLATVRDDALAWFDRWLGEDGLVRDVEGWLFADWTPARLDGTSLYFSAVRRQVDLALGRPARLDSAAAASAFAQAQRPAWRDVVGSPATSQQSNAHAVLAGLLSGDAGRRAMDDVMASGVLLDRTVAPAVVSERLDIERQAVAAQPYQGAFVLDALASLDMGHAAVTFLRNRWVPIARASPTLSEFFDTSGSRCHPWSTAPTAWLTRHGLGLWLTGPSLARVQVLDLGLRAAAGSLPTPHGPLRFEWDVDGAGRRGGALDVPDGLEVEVVGAEGERSSVRGPGRRTVAL